MCDDIELPWLHGIVMRIGCQCQENWLHDPVNRVESYEMQRELYGELRLPWKYHELPWTAMDCHDCHGTVMDPWHRSWTLMKCHDMS